MVTLFLRTYDKKQFDSIKEFVITFVECNINEKAFLEVQNYTTKNKDINKEIYHTFILADNGSLFDDKLEALKKCIEKMDYKINFNYFKD